MSCCNLEDKSGKLARRDVLKGTAAIAAVAAGATGFAAKVFRAVRPPIKVSRITIPEGLRTKSSAMMNLLSKL